MSSSHSGPFEYDARFSQLAGAKDEFSLSVSHRGVERPALWRALNHRYPFPLLAQDVEVPIMDPDEILAEKIVAWWLFGHAKHYNDIAFLAARMVREGRRDRDPNIKKLVSDLIEIKLQRNREIGATQARRVNALSTPERRRRLAQPADHVNPGEQKGFNGPRLSPWDATRPRRGRPTRAARLAAAAIRLIKSKRYALASRATHSDQIGALRSSSSSQAGAQNRVRQRARFWLRKREFGGLNKPFACNDCVHSR